LSLIAIKLGLHVHNYFNVQRSAKEKENTAHHFVSNEHYQSALHLQQMSSKIIQTVHKIEKSAIGLF
jgi:hypothetical protein